MQRNALNLALFACGSLGLQMAWGQETPDASITTLPTITVTGSHIPRIESETALPVLVLRRADIVRSGASSVKELIDSLTSSSQVGSENSHSLSDISGGNAFAAGASSASLRNLGHQATLVLLNSRRLAPFAMDDDPGMFVNLDTLPLDAIERIEVLRSGASALYGSDAIAGVINVITRRDYRGAQVQVSQQQSLHASAFQSRTASITAGVGDLGEDRYNMLMNVELFRRSGVMWGQVLSQSNSKLRERSPQFGNESIYSYPGNIGFAAVPGCREEQVRGGLCYYDRYARLQAQPTAERANFLLSGELHIDATLKGFAEVLYSSTQTRYENPLPVYAAFSSPVTWFNPSTGQPRNFFPKGLPAQHPLNTAAEEGVDFAHRFGEAPSYTQVDANNYRALVGLRGTYQAFDWESALGALGGEVTNRSQGALSVNAFSQLIGDLSPASDPLFFNRAYTINQPNSAQTIAALFPQYTLRAKNTLTFLDGKISGPLTTLEGRQVRMAVGFDLRHESLDITPSDNLLQGDIVGQGAASTQGRRTFGALFGELSIPLSTKLEMQAAARIDQYPGLAPHLSPKLALRFEASPKLVLRGNIEAGFRAPNLSENSTSTRYAFAPYLSDPKRCPQAQALANSLRNSAQLLPDSDPNKLYTQLRGDAVESQECSIGIATLRTYNPDLQPEKSLATSLGFAIAPAKGYLASLDYWAIRRTNEIGFKTPQELLNSEDSLPAGVVNRQAPGNDVTFTDAERVVFNVQSEALTWTNGQIGNVSKTFTSGLDLSARSRTVTPWGAVSTGLQAAYLLNYFNFSPLRAGYGDNLAGRYNYPRLRSALSVALGRGAFTNALQLNWTSSTSLQGDFFNVANTPDACAARGWSAGDCRVRHASTLDYAFVYAPVRRFNVSIQVRNLLNQRPPVDLRAFFENGGGTVPQDLRDVQRRVLKVALEYKF
jgi:iron complex outermembrane recepter protein